jgi:hypothetical protein
MSRYLVGQSFTPQTVRAVFDDFAMDGIVVFKREAHVWDGQRHRSELAALTAELGESVELVAEDDTHAVFLRRVRGVAERAA